MCERVRSELSDELFSFHPPFSQFLLSFVMDEIEKSDVGEEEDHYVDE